jgi:hypothetical protein
MEQVSTERSSTRDTVQFVIYFQTKMIEGSVLLLLLGTVLVSGVSKISRILAVGGGGASLISITNWCLLVYLHTIIHNMKV